MGRLIGFDQDSSIRDGMWQSFIGWKESIRAWLWPWTSWNIFLPPGKLSRAIFYNQYEEGIHVFCTYKRDRYIHVFFTDKRLKASPCPTFLFGPYKMMVFNVGNEEGIYVFYFILQGASCVHFQDFNSEVLQCLTIPNVVANLPVKSESLSSEVRFFAGDWSEVHQILPNLQTDDLDSNCSSGANSSFGYDVILMAETVYSISTLPVGI